MMQLGHRFPCRPVRGLLIDITGVLYDYGSRDAISGSREAMQRLVSSNLPFKLLTNQAKDRSDKLLHYLHEYGFTMVTQAQDMLSPVPAAICLMRNRGVEQPFLLVDQKVKSEFTQSFDDKDCEPDCVLVGDIGHNFTYENICRALHHLNHMEKPLLLSLGSAMHYRFRGRQMLDVGFFVKVLEHSADVTALVIGKPSPQYFAMGLNALAMSASDVLMIGDDVVSDVTAAESCGIAGLLVLTGKGVRSCDSVLKEKCIVAKDFEAAVDMVLRHNESVK